MPWYDMDMDKDEKTNKNAQSFDDCPVCRAQQAAGKKGGAPTVEEMRVAFQKAKDNGAVVGGEWFEEVRK